MKKIEAIVRPLDGEPVKAALLKLGIGGMTATEVQGFGRQKGHGEIYRGCEYTVNFLPKLKIEIVVNDDICDRVVNAIIEVCNNGKIGAGKIFVSDVIDAVRIRTEERGSTPSQHIRVSSAIYTTHTAMCESFFSVIIILKLLVISH